MILCAKRSLQDHSFDRDCRSVRPKAKPPVVAASTAIRMRGSVVENAKRSGRLRLVERGSTVRHRGVRIRRRPEGMVVAG